ncbi:hypothetical protein E0Z10_g5009 [Xylaria hypoxylon]|uniref:non-specific serine/threonine protein kinase n=1 Tax=Xylaria hypoxylon TaxID=37992 RepID=A0A4Z0YJT9_9PEZI|nr:hypothetical protein E0Z10_g5009 [Xylaria hypoxylon]
MRSRVGLYPLFWPSDTYQFKESKTLLASFALLELSSDYWDNLTTFEQATPKATECALEFCALAYETQMTDGVLRESLISMSKARVENSYSPAGDLSPDTLGLIQKDFGYSLTESTSSWSSSESPGTLSILIPRHDLQVTLSQDADFKSSPRVFNITQMSIATMMYDLAKNSTLNSMTFGISNTTNITQTFDNIAHLLTYRMREVDGTITLGFSQQWIVFIHVRWEFIIFPVILLISGYIFTIANSDQANEDATGHMHSNRLNLAKTEYSQYAPVEDTELIDDYETGGYHPIHIGDRLGSKGRFNVVHKLGFGGHSTVWLAQDEAEGRYVALKVAVAANNHVLRERSIIQALEESLGNRRNISVPKLHAAFTHTGPNGVHECLATDPGMCSLSRSNSASDGVWLFDLAVSRKMTAQLIRTTSFLHSQGIAHGDLHLGNVLLKLPALSSMPVSSLYAKYGEPIKEDVIRLDGASLSAHVPQYVVTPAWLGKKCEDVTLADAEVLLTDFGESWKPANTPRYTLNTPALYRPPEAMFAAAEQCPFSLAADIWTLGCSIFAIFGQLDLFEGFYPTEDDVFAENISALGKPPHTWWNLWGARQEFFNAQGKWAVNTSRVVDGEYRCLETRVHRIKRDRRGVLGDEEMADLISMLRGMLRWRPDERVSALDLATGTWMTKWCDKTD